MYICSHCDTQSLKWQGRCPECGKWGTFGEETASQSQKKNKQGAHAAPLVDLKDAKVEHAKRTPTGISELDRVLSGGVVGGSVILLAGEPGIGKSTLVAQVAGLPRPLHNWRGDDRDPPPAMGELEGAFKKVMYVSGEESQGQLLMRFKRLNIEPDHVHFSSSIEVGSIIAAASKEIPSLLIIDSIQTMIPDDVEALAGSPTSVRAATAQLIGLAKSRNIPILLIGQVTKDGTVAGPKTLEHLVDTVLTLEGDRATSYRILRAAKHRFGTTDEVGVFEMTENGMQAVENPSAKFLEERQETPGSVVTCVMEGSRPFLVEVQALAEKSFFSNPIRRTSGFDAGRLQMLLAIIGKRAGVNVSGHDVYVNVVGGMKIKETAADLAVAAAVISSVKDKMMPKGSVVIGELGLGGEVRSVGFLDRRVKEAKRLGLDHAITPKNTKTIRELFS